jgi:hypothetical protein
VAFRQALEALGWSEGRNIHIDYRFAGDPARVQAYAVELVNAALELIVAYSTPVVAALKQATTTIPIVFAAVNDPLGQGFVASLARPRAGDFALEAVAATVTASDGKIAEARIALTGVGPTPVRARKAEVLLRGKKIETRLIERVIEAVRAAIAPDSGLHASSDYRRHLAGVLTGRAVSAAWKRVTESIA